MFKFEEEKTYIDHEIQRYLIILNVEDSFSINFKEIINKSDPNFIYADLDMLCIANSYGNGFPLEDIRINNDFIYSNYSFQQIIETNNNYNMEVAKEHKVIYKQYKIKKNINEEDSKNNYNNKQSEYTMKKRKQKLNKKIKNLEKKINLEFLKRYDYLQMDNNIEQNHIKHYFCNLLAKNYIIFNWCGEEKITKKKIYGILLYKPKLNFSLIKNSLFKNVIKNFISMKYNIIKMDKNCTICIIDVFIDNNFYKQLQNIKGIEIYVDNKDKNIFQKLKWVGLKNYYLSNIDNNSDDIDKIQFTCLINEKGTYDLNKINLAIHYIISRDGVQKFDNILSPIIVKVD